MAISKNNVIEASLLSCNSDWETKALHIMKENGWDARISSHQIIAWKKQQIITISDNLFFVSGISIGKIWLGGIIGNNAVRIVPRRFYFDSISTNKPLYLPENKLLKGKSRPPVDRNSLYKLLDEIKILLCSEGPFNPIHQQPLFLQDNLLSQVKAIGRNNSRISLSNDIWFALSKSGVSNYPKELNLYVVNNRRQQKGGDILNDYIGFLQEKWKQLTGDPEALHIKRLDLDKLIERLQARSSTDNLPNTIFLIGISGQVGDPLPKRQQEALARLDESGFPYRLFSYENENKKYSASNQIISLLSGVGGKPYKMVLSYPEDFSSGALIGVDIGHDSNRGRSTVVTSLLEPDGNHILSLKKNIPLNEAISSPLVTHMLRSLKKLSEDSLSRTIEKAIIFRDGRIPSKSERSRNESLQDYLDAMGIPTSLIEIRKRGNPPLYQKTGSSLRSAPPGSVFFPEDSEVRFITCYETPQKAGPPNTFKVTIPHSADTFNWGLDAYAGIVCGLCYSPSLGTKPHLPGPIYWADGIAKTSDTDNRFRGQNVRIID